VWLSYSIYKPPVLNDLDEIDRNVGVWVHVTEDCVLYTSGIPYNSTSIDLYAGWNLVGYPTLNASKTISIALWGTGADMVEGHDPVNPYHISELPSDYLMQPGEGYWVRVPVDTVWVVDW
jgi:hypothetical protein